MHSLPIMNRREIPGANGRSDRRFERRWTGGMRRTFENRSPRLRAFELEELSVAELRQGLESGVSHRQD
jgi:hypothetical protein